ncbi:MAG: hypothetical protein V2B13_08715 [Pseudomonadota bacterium]
METIKSVGQSGQISLGKKFAGKTVLVDQIESGVWIVKVGQFIPESERWLNESKVRMEIDEAVTWAEKNPPRKSNLKAIQARLKK